MAVNENKYFGKVTKVMDGDTFEALIDLGFGIKQEFHVRLDGIDTPELSTEQGQKAKQFVIDLIENKQVIFRDSGPEKFGRARARVELPDGKDLTDYLIKKKIGYEYHGGKKQKTVASLSLIGMQPLQIVSD
jgi:endonuclease YncB( thermonuclease family)